MKENVYVICGGAKVNGIGIAVSEQLAQIGKVVVTGATQSETEEGVAFLRSKAINVTAAICDITKSEDIQSLVETATAAGTVAGLVIVAGLTPQCGDWKKIVEVDLIGHINMMKAFQQVMETGTGIVSFGSSSAYLLPPEAVEGVKDTLYSADEISSDELLDKLEPVICSRGADMASNLAYTYAKKGTLLQAQKQAVILGISSGIRVNTVSPGIADTVNNSQEYERSFSTTDQRMYKMVNEFTPAKRMADCREIATVVEFLLSDNASFVSGIDILIDGGCLANQRLQRLIP